MQCLVKIGSVILCNIERIVILSWFGKFRSLEVLVFFLNGAQLTSNVDSFDFLSIIFMWMGFF